MCKQFKDNETVCCKIPSRPLALSSGLDLKRSGTELTIANQIDLGIELQKNAAELRRVRSPDIPLYQCFGERRIKK